MSEFEYFSVMIGVILALGVTHILGQAGRVVQGTGFVRLYWVHACWVCLVLLSHFAAWWNIWQLRATLEFSYAGFLYILLGPTALFLAARVLVPSLNSVRADLESHYYRARRAFFGLMAVFIVWPTLLDLVFGSARFPANGLRHAVFLAPVVACALLSSRLLHAAVTVLILSAFLVTMAVS